MATQGEMYEERSEAGAGREDYPRDKSGKIPMSTPSGHIPGSMTRNDSITATRTVGPGQISGRSAAGCADEMGSIVPGAGPNKNPLYKK